MIHFDVLLADRIQIKKRGRAIEGPSSRQVKSLCKLWDDLLFKDTAYRHRM